MIEILGVRVLNFMRRIIGLVFVSVFLLVVSVSVVITQTKGKETVVFIGQPTHKVSEGGLERTPEVLNKSKSTASICVIVKVKDKYFWKTRENVEMIKIESGAFVHFIAPASGYVKYTKPEMRKFVEFMSPTEKKFGYIEHMSIGLRSVNYWGNDYSVSD